MLKSMIGNLIVKHFKKKLESLTITEEDVTEVLREIRISLLDADVNLLVVKKLIGNIRSKAVGSTIDQGANPQDVLLTIVKNELIEVLGKQNQPIITEKSFVNIMMVGLQGSGKTTTCAKLANLYQTKYQKKVLLVGIDIYRPAAIEQLNTLAKENNIVFFAKGTQDPVLTASEAKVYAKTNNFDVVIYDTAGRLQTNDELMDELKNVRNKITPDEILFVADAMSGQNIIDVAKVFNTTLSLTGFILTKFDSDARAGAALSLVSLLDLPIKLIGTGEKVGSIEKFYPERIADRILGLGDIMTLAEKASEVIDENQVKKSYTKMLSGKMDLDDLLIQMRQMSKLGNLKSIMSFMPNLGNKISESDLDNAQNKMQNFEVIISSMTLKERKNPQLFKKEPTRKTRVVRGCGKSVDEFNKLINE
jgi:signal recognition particle subunit SRP54